MRPRWLPLLAMALLVWLPHRAWALRCGGHVVKQGEVTAQVREACGEPFFINDYVGRAGAGVTAPGEPAVAAITEAWYYNFGPQRLMVRLEFSGGVLVREETLGYGFSGRAGPCDFIGVTTGMSVADLIARCGFPAERTRNNLAVAAYAGARAPAWGETWFYAADGSRAAREVRLRHGRVVGVQVVH